MFKDRDLRKLCEDSFSRVKHDMDQLNVKQTDQQKEMDQMKEKLLNLYGMLTDMQAALADPVKKESEAKEETKQERKKKDFVVSMRSGKVHQRECFFARKIDPRHRLLFDTKLDAVNDGYAVCSACA
ncbi:hypothetical protein CMO91_01920 [Candidatus Woesearchaeota archaeon]|nr:hypothetical protein [Candidatus Woesearchaeota archaeon]